MDWLEEIEFEQSRGRVSYPEGRCKSLRPPSLKPLSVAFDSLRVQQAAELPDAARDHSFHHHADRRDVGDPRHGRLHRQTASTMGNDGFRVLRVAFAAPRSRRSFWKRMRKNPELTREEYAFVKSTRRSCAKSAFPRSAAAK